MAFGFIGAALGAVAGIGQIITGNSQRRQANRLEQQNIFPTANVNSNILQNTARADLASAQGIPAEQYNLALQNINRNQSAALRSFERGGRFGSLASIVRGANDATMQLDSVNTQQRIANQQYADQARLNLAQEEQRVWDWNYAQPYMRNLQNIAQLRQAGNQNTWGGIGTILNTGLSVFGNQMLGQQGQSQTQAPRTQNMIGSVTPTTFNYTPSLYRPLPI